MGSLISFKFAPFLKEKLIDITVNSTAKPKSLANIGNKIKEKVLPLLAKIPTKSKNLKHTSIGILAIIIILVLCCIPSKKPITFNVNGVELTVMPCPAGTFMMGSPSGELGRDINETQHSVTISKDFYIAKYPVTQAQYKAVMGNNPSHFKGDNNPVECVSWFKAKEFCDKLNEVTGSTRPAGYKFDLPTEAQWEYACRAGTTTSLNSGKNITSENDRCSNLDEVGWYAKNSDYKTHPVGLKKPNAWGIYDMHGNVLEWCSDWYGEYPSGISTDPEGPVNGYVRVRRGGSWISDPRACRSAYRSRGTPDNEIIYLGFRFALVPSSK